MLKGKKGNLILRLRKVGARLGQGWGKVLGKVGARSGQGWGKVRTKSKVQARSGQARLGQGWGKVGARSGQKARFGQGRGKLAAIPMYLLIYSPISSTSISVSTPVSRLSPYLSFLFFLSIYSILLTPLYQSLCLFYLYFSISISIAVSILSLHLSLYLFYIYLQIYPCMSDILHSIGVVEEFQR